MKKISFFIILIGLIILSFGIYKFFNSPKKEDKNENKELFLFQDVTQKEQEKVNDYLNLKYNENFKILEHTARFCIMQNDDGYTIDYFCDNDDIIDDIYKVEDNKNIIFYVKKVTVKDNVEINNANLDTQSNGFYDNYVLYNVIEKLNKELLNDFSLVLNCKSVSLIKGLGLELPKYEKNNDKYLYYSIYDSLDGRLYNLVDKNISVNEYIKEIGKLNIDSTIELEINIDDELSLSNVKEYIKNIYDNEYINLNYGLFANKILFIFLNKEVIKYEQGSIIEIMKYENDLNNLYKIYDKDIVFDYSLENSNAIHYDKFMKLRNIVFNDNN